MKRKITLGSSVGLIIMAAALTFTITWISCISAFNSRLSEFNEKESTYNKIAEINQIVRAYYVNDIELPALQEGLAMGYIYGMGDKYARYFSAEDYKDMMQNLNGEFAGIGVNVIYDEKTGGILVVNVMKNSPALSSGVKSGDIIVKVGSEEVAALGYEMSVSRMLGEVGSTAVFTVLRNGEYLDFHIVRQVFSTTTVSASMISGSVAYIQISEFNEATVKDFSDALQKLKADGAEYLVFDVRNNPGGELNSICSVLDMLLPEGPIINMVSKQGVIDTIHSNAEQENLPIAVLTNNNTYSAAELFAAALKDYGKALLVGETTHGKGTMQTILPLSDGSAVSISTAMYNPPYSENYEGTGVVPQIEVALPEQFRTSFYTMTPEQDTQLQRAIAELKAGTVPVSGVTEQQKQARDDQGEGAAQ